MSKPRTLLPPVHPGEILREDFMKPLRLTVNKLALDLRVRESESQRSAKTVRGIGQMHERRRDVRFLNRRMNILGAAAPDALNEVRIVVSRALTGWPRFGLIRYPRLVCIISIDGQIAV